MVSLFLTILSSFRYPKHQKKESKNLSPTQCKIRSGLEDNSINNFKIEASTPNNSSSYFSNAEFTHSNNPSRNPSDSTKEGSPP